MNDVRDFMSANNIEYILHEYPAVYTCEEADKHCSHIPGIACKNLFLRDQKKKRYFLLVLAANKQVNLKEFAEVVGETNVSFASEKDLYEKLKLEPGSVSPFGLINNADGNVEVYIDRVIYDSEIVGFHPNRNTATLELSKEMFHEFLKVVKQKVDVIDL